MEPITFGVRRVGDSRTPLVQGVWRRALRRLDPGLGIAFLFAGGMLLLAALINAIAEAPSMLQDMLRDAGAVAGFHFGALSTLGVMFWSFTAGIAMFAGLAGAVHRGLNAESRFLIGAGLLTLYIALDDGLMLHDGWFERHTILPQEPIYAAIGIGALWVLWTGRSLLRGIGLRTVLAIGFLCGATSVGIDLSPYESAYRVAEDILKLIALSMWCGIVLSIAWGSVIGSAATQRR